MKYLLLGLTFFTSAAFAQNVPLSIAKQIPNGWVAQDVVEAHLNNDNQKDVVLVVENKKDEQVPRKLMVFFKSDEGYQLSGTSESVVYCEKCGGIMGDPYSGIEVVNKKIIVHNYGGSAWRWSSDYTFAYSRIDQKWQLVRMEKSSFHTSNPEKSKTTLRLPKDFGKINLEEFNPERFD